MFIVSHSNGKLFFFPDFFASSEKSDSLVNPVITSVPFVVMVIKSSFDKNELCYN